MSWPNGVEFVDELPDNGRRKTKWTQIQAILEDHPGRWARIDAKGGYPRQRLAALGCEVRVITVEGEPLTFARWPA